MLFRAKFREDVVDKTLMSMWSANTTELLKILSDPDGIKAIDMELLTDKLNNDQPLLDLILEKLNAGNRRRKTRITTPRDALLLVGIEPFRNIVLFFLVESLFQKKYKKNRASMMLYKYYWDHAFSTAIAAEEIALVYGMDELEAFLMYTYGLMHDVGHVIVDQLYPKEAEQISVLLEQDIPMLEAEGYILDGLTHQDIGALVCENVGFSERIVDAVKNHHHPFDVSDPGERLRILAIADSLSFSIVRPKYINEQDYLLDSKWVESLGLSLNDIFRVQRRTGMRFEKLKTSEQGRYRFSA